MGKKKHSKKTQIFVLDSSVTLAWFFEDESDAYADSVQDALVRDMALVPALWPLEIANALVVGERRKRTTEAKANKFVNILKALPIQIDDQTVAHAWAIRCFSLATIISRHTMHLFSNSRNDAPFR